jgi:hypothetical protein
MKYLVKNKISWLFYLLFWILILRVPSELPIYTHDSSSEALLEYFFENNYLGGRDFVQNVGPLGFLSYPDIFKESIFWPKLLLLTFITSSIALVFLNFKRDFLDGYYAYLFLFFCVILTNWDSLLYLYFFVLGLYIFFSIYSNKEPDFKTLLLSLLSVFILALAKSFYFYLGLGYLVLTLLSNTSLRNKILLCAITTLLLFQGLKVLNFTIKDFFSLLNAQVYFTEMYVSNLNTFPLGLNSYIGLVLIVGITLQILRLMNKRMGIRSVVIALYLLFVSLVCYQHSTIRADVHITALLDLCIGSSLIFLGYKRKNNAKI